MSVSKCFNEKLSLFQRTFMYITKRNSTDINSIDYLSYFFEYCPNSTDNEANGNVINKNEDHLVVFIK